MKTTMQQQSALPSNHIHHQCNNKAQTSNPKKKKPKVKNLHKIPKNSKSQKEEVQLPNPKKKEQLPNPKKKVQQNPLFQPVQFPNQIHHCPLPLSILFDYGLHIHHIPFL